MLIHDYLLMSSTQSSYFSMQRKKFTFMEETKTHQQNCEKFHLLHLQNTENHYELNK